MPFRSRRKPRRRYTRRKFPRRFRKKMVAPSRTLGRSVMPFSDMYKVKLRFNEKELAAGATARQYDYRFASAYDPRYAAGGASCKGFPTLSTIYQKYLCTGSAIYVTACSTGLGNALATTARVVVFPWPDVAPVAPASAELAADYPYARSKIIGGAGGTTVTRLKSYISFRKLFGLPRSYQSDPNNSADTGTNIANDGLWSVFVESVDGATALNVIALYITVVYYLRFSDRKNVA